jgi:hypothetical protein
MAELDNAISSAANAATAVATGSASLKPDGVTKSTPNPAVAMLYFFIITGIYCIISIVINTGNAMQKVIMKGGYILCVIMGEFFINLNLTGSMCGVYQFQSALFITIVPWLLIFGVLQAFLTVFPGWLSPFSNTFGYLAVKLMGLPKLMEDITVENTNHDAPAYRAINDLKNDPSLLINQFASETPIDKLNLTTGKREIDAITGHSIKIRPKFDSAWKNLQKSSIIKPVGAPDYDDVKMQEKFYHYVEMKSTISELIWNLLTGMLVTSVSYNYIINTSCAKSAEEIKKRHDAYEASQNSKLRANANFQANQPNYVQTA